MAIIKQKQDFAKNVSLQEYNTKTQQNLFHYFLKNEVFQMLKKVIDRLFESVNATIHETIKSIKLQRLEEFNRFIGFQYHMQRTENTKALVDTEHPAIPFPSGQHNSQYGTNRCILNFLSNLFLEKTERLSDTVRNLKASFFIFYFFI